MVTTTELIDLKTNNADFQRPRQQRRRICVQGQTAHRRKGVLPA